MSKHKLLLYSCFLVIAGLLFIATHDYPPVPTKDLASPVVAVAAKPTLRQDPQVVAVMQRLGLDYSKLNLIYGPNPNSSRDASFTTPNSLYITSSVRPDNLDVMVSHEYLHYVQTQPSADVMAIDPDIETVLARDHYLQGRVASYYGCGAKCFSIDNEAIAYACTEMPDYALTPKIVNWCDTYLPKRSLLFSQ